MIKASTMYKLAERDTGLIIAEGSKAKMSRLWNQLGRDYKLWNSPSKKVGDYIGVNTEGA